MTAASVCPPISTENDICSYSTGGEGGLQPTEANFRASKQ